jgi:hypothetical protein
MSPFEASLWNLVNSAIGGHLPSILKCIKICEEYEILAPPPVATGGGVFRAPKGVDFYEWLESLRK